MPLSSADKFMLQEHSRMIDVYQDLHVQKNELLKVYLAFVSIPVSIVAVFLSLYNYLDTNPSLRSVLEVIQSAAVYLSVLLILVGVAVLMIMLKIRGEQYLYVQTVNVARKYFKETGPISPNYLALPSERNQFTFAQSELSGRPFWESMIVGLTTSMLLAFLTWEFATRLLGQQKSCSTILAAAIFVASASFFAWFVRSRLRKAIRACELTDLAAPARGNG